MALSTVDVGEPHKFVGRSDDGYCNTKDEPNSWMSVDLGEGRAVVPAHYCLRHDENSSYALRNWALEGKTAERSLESLTRPGRWTRPSWPSSTTSSSR